MKSWTIAINVAMSLEFYSPWIRLLIRLRMMLEAYQREWMMMMERPPWPPPPLIPLPQLAGRPGGATATRARTHRGAEEWSQWANCGPIDEALGRMGKKRVGWWAELAIFFWSSLSVYVFRCWVEYVEPYVEALDTALMMFCFHWCWHGWAQDWHNWSQDRSDTVALRSVRMDHSWSYLSTKSFPSPLIWADMFLTFGRVQPCTTLGIKNSCIAKFLQGRPCIQQMFCWWFQHVSAISCVLDIFQVDWYHQYPPINSRLV